MAGRYRQKYKRDDQFITHNFDFEWHDYSYGMQPEVNQYEAAMYGYRRLRYISPVPEQS